MLTPFKLVEGLCDVFDDVILLGNLALKILKVSIA